MLPNYSTICTGVVYKSGVSVIPRVGIIGKVGVAKNFWDKRLDSTAKLKRIEKATNVKRLVASTYRCLGCQWRFARSEVLSRQFRIVTDTGCICSDCAKMKEAKRCL